MNLLISLLLLFYYSCFGFDNQSNKALIDVVNAHNHLNLELALILSMAHRGQKVIFILWLMSLPGLVLLAILFSVDDVYSNNCRGCDTYFLELILMNVPG